MSAKRETMSEQFIRSALPNWGETAILLISTHGLIIKGDNEEEVRTFVVPDGVTIKRAAVSVPGECNIASETDVDGYVRVINRYMPELLSNRDTTQNHAINTVLGTIRGVDVRDLGYKRMTVTEDEKRKERGDETFDESDDEHLQNYKRYIRHFDKGHKFKIFEEGQQILNKKYLRTNSEATRNDWVVNVLSIPGHPDLFSFIKTQTRFGDTKMTLQEIVQFLQEKGVKNIIIFDLSCSNIAMPDHEEYDQRTVRYQRRLAKKEGYGGKRNKKYNTKRRTKKNRKTRKYYKK